MVGVEVPRLRFATLGMTGGDGGLGTRRRVLRFRSTPSCVAGLRSGQAPRLRFATLGMTGGGGGSVDGPGRTRRSCPTGNGERPGDRWGICPTGEGHGLGRRQAPAEQEGAASAALRLCSGQARCQRNETANGLGRTRRSCPTGNGERPGDRSGICPTGEGHGLGRRQAPAEQEGAASAASYRSNEGTEG